MRKIFLLLALLTGAIGFSQNIKFEGVIEDAVKNPLEMANIMAVNLDTKAMDAYAITNDKGKFLLNLKANANYSIRVSFLGMKSQDISIVTQGENIKRTITLEEGGIDLEGVEIIHEMPVSIKGDTIIYNADSFKTGTEKKLEDVLKKLPGVEVNADGEIEVEGKKVQKLMVEGKDFFDGDTKLGVKNIPADAIDKVQVLRNYNEIGALKGLENNQDNIAMNIKLKKGKKNFWFGDMTAGIGVGHDESRYVVNPKLFYYSPKYSVNLIGNFNNIGELPFTAQDYFKFTGGFRSMMQKGGTNFNISTNDLGLSLLRNNRAKEIETDFGATNFSYNPTKAWTISGFIIGSSTLTDLQTKTQTNILQPDSDEVASTENRNQATHQKSNLGLFKLSSSYKPNTKLQVDYDALLKLSSQDEDGQLVSEVFPNTGQSQTVNTERKQSPVSLNQNLGMYYTMDDKNVFAFETQHLYTNEDPFYNPDLGVSPFPAAGANELGIVPQDRFNINQQRFVQTNKIDSKLDYYYMLTPKSNVNLTLGNTNSRQNFDSYIFQILDNGQQNNLNQDLTANDVTYSFNDLFLGLHYKFITGKFTFNPGFSVHKFNTYNDQKATRVRDDFFRLQPDVFALYQIKKSETLSYNFAITSDFTDINRFAENVTLSNYNSLFSGNRNLESATMQVHSLRYFKYNMFNFTNIFANINYTRKVNAIKSNYLFLGNNQVSTAENIASGFADESLSGSANYGRSFFKYYKASVGFNAAWSKSNNIRRNVSNTEIVETKESFTHSYTIKASTNYKTLPNLEIGYNIGINTYSGTTFYTERPFARLDYYFLSSLALVADYSFYHYTNNDDNFPVDNEYDFLDASLVYQKKDSKWEYKVGVTNLLNTTSLNDDSFSPPVISSSQYFVQPRYIIFSMKYNL